jgi:predicted transcriptional regulator YheO
MTKPDLEQRLLLEQLEQIARGLGETFAPFCEVAVHDLLNPKRAIRAIHNNLSGRKVGDPSTEHGLARIADSEYPQVVANYANRFADGRQVKSTSIGIRNASGRYVAALCLNIDLTLFHGLQNVLSQFSAVDTGKAVKESLDPASAQAIRARIDQFAAGRSTTPRALTVKDRRTLLRDLKGAGFMEMRKSTDIIARHLGVSRATVYLNTKDAHRTNA